MDCIKIKDDNKKGYVNFDDRKIKMPNVGDIVQVKGDFKNIPVFGLSPTSRKMTFGIASSIFKQDFD